MNLVESSPKIIDDDIAQFLNKIQGLLSQVNLTI